MKQPPKLPSNLLKAYLGPMRRLVQKWRTDISLDAKAIRWLLAAFSYGTVGYGSLFFLISCTHSPTLSWTDVPAIEGAVVIGSDQCKLCHPIDHEEYEVGAHAFAGSFNSAQNLDTRCESCHGAGSMHFATGGGSDYIINPANKPDICLQCHYDLKAQFNLPGAHPLTDGKLSCTECHNPHSEARASNISHGTSPHDQACFECHKAQSGPFVFAHEAMREGCTQCHDPHGSANDKMLIARNANLCLQCHQTILSETDVLLGGQVHTGLNYLNQGTCWTAGCHEAVHGSNVSPKLRY
jgi:predicted CXXCH cytochrome family protein